jgi:hypothetical protein
VEGAGKGKVGYRKLSFCGKQAASDGLQFFWVDTCCIDKLSSAEPQEAINSMFQWHHRADKCYVYLMFQLVAWLKVTHQSTRRGNKPFRIADGSPEAGRSKSFLRRRLLIFFLPRANGLGTKLPFCKRFTLLLEYLRKLLEDTLCISLVLNRGYRGQRDTRRNAKRTKRTHYWAYLKSTYRLSMAKEQTMRSGGS